MSKIESPQMGKSYLEKEAEKPKLDVEAKREEINKENELLNKEMQELNKRALELGEGKYYKRTEDMDQRLNEIFQKMDWHARLWNEIGTKEHEFIVRSEEADPETREQIKKELYLDDAKAFEANLRNEIRSSTNKLLEQIENQNLAEGTKIEIDGAKRYFGRIDRGSGLIFASEKPDLKALSGYDVRNVKQIQKLGENRLWRRLRRAFHELI